MSIEEKILIGEIQKSNHVVFQALFHEYYPKLTRFAERFIFNRQIAEDLVQNLFMHLWEQADKIYIQTSLKAYLYQSTKNRCLNYLRDLQIQDKHQLLYLQALLSDTDEDWQEEDEIAKTIRDAIAKLPPKMAEIFELKYLQGKKQKEIAVQLHVTENTVKTQLNRGKAKVKQFLLESTRLKFFL